MRRVFGLGGLAIVAILAAVGLWTLRSPAEEVTSRRYPLRWSEREAVVLGEPFVTPLEVATELEVELAMTVWATEGRPRLAALSFVAVTRAEVTLAGKALPLGSLSRGRLLVSLGPDGTPVGYREEGIPAEARDLLRRVAGEIFFADDAGLVEERVMQGQAISRIEGGRKRRERYSKLAAFPVEAPEGSVRHEVVVTRDGGGAPRSARGEEETRLRGDGQRRYERDFRLELGEGVTHETPPRPPVLDEAAVTRFDETGLERVEAAGWEQIAEDMRWVDVEAGVLATPAEPTHWFRRFVALLMIEPAQADAAALLFARRDVGFEGRTRLLDGLAAAGHARAQAAMRTILASPEARADEKAWSRYVQSLRFLERPEGETLDFAANEMRSQDGDGRLAAATSWGSLARKSADAERRDVARTELLGALAAAPTPKQAHALLGALENLGDPATFETLAAHAKRGPNRPAAVRALRRLETPEAQAFLLAQVGDRDVGVQMAAIYALGRSPVEERTVALRVAEVARAGGIKLRAAPLALGLLEKLDDAMLRREALRGLRPAVSFDPALVARVDALLAVTP
jgi:hypothetical protein